MKKIFKLEFVVSAVCFLLFLLLIWLLKVVDVKAIGPQNSYIGLATLNKLFADEIGVSKFWYNLTEVLGYIAILTAFCFAILGLYQLIKRKSFKKVDKNLYVLLGLYLLIVITYVLFEKVIINYRPVLNAELEASFPSTHTMLVLCISGSAIIEIDRYIKDKKVGLTIKIILFLIILLTVVGRLLSGVHWFTDILGGLLISTCFVSLYAGFIRFLNN